MLEGANLGELVLQCLAVVEILAVHWIIIAWIVEEGTIKLHVLNVDQRWKELDLNIANVTMLCLTQVKGNMKYLYALMDDDTRFWIDQEPFM